MTVVVGPDAVVGEGEPNHVIGGLSKRTKTKTRRCQIRVVSVPMGRLCIQFGTVRRQVQEGYRSRELVSFSSSGMFPDVRLWSNGENGGPKNKCDGECSDARPEEREGD